LGPGVWSNVCSTRIVTAKAGQCAMLRATRRGTPIRSSTSAKASSRARTNADSSSRASRASSVVPLNCVAKLSRGCVTPTAICFLAGRERQVDGHGLQRIFGCDRDPPAARRRPGGIDRADKDRQTGFETTINACLGHKSGGEQHYESFKKHLGSA
jgi:hypothetical protein